MSEKTSLRTESEQNFDSKSERALDRNDGPGLHHDGSGLGGDAPPESDSGTGPQGEQNDRSSVSPDSAKVSEAKAWPLSGQLEPGGWRSLLVRAADELVSWVGDEDAARRREEDSADAKPRHCTRSDVSIKKDVCDDLTEDPALDASEIVVSVTDQNVTLEGNVRDSSAKQRAEDCAYHVAGVRQIHNNLKVSSAQSGSEAFAPGSAS